jgi:type II secretory pathway component PulL
MPVRCAELLRDVSVRLSGIEARLAEVRDRSDRAGQTAAQLLRSTAAHETRLTLLEAADRTSRETRRTWSGRVWQLIKAAVLVVAGYVLRKAET